MLRSPFDSSILLPTVFAGLVAAGVAIHGAFASPIRVLPALVLTGIGLYGVASFVGERSIEFLRYATKRAWSIAIVAVIPYGLATAPSTEEAAAAGELFAGPIAGVASEAVAGAAILSAVAITVVYAMARYGVHPDRPTPEERVLGEEWDD